MGGNDPVGDVDELRCHGHSLSRDTTLQAMIAPSPGKHPDTPDQSPHTVMDPM